jgi:asparagine synthase (glutamine-hydrolysing)
MCGIVGVCVTDERDIRGTLERMTATIVHRGPDDDGFFYDRGVGIGMRRLSIIDLPGGHQPIANEDDTRWIVFNGEIYNYQSLGPELRAAGHHFRTHSDTETIVHAFEQFGPDCVHHFNGMFAFAIWDTRQRRLFAARDRLGVKPLYYFWDGSTLVFASEMKAILASGLVPREVDDDAIWHYLTFRYIPAPLTIWKGIRKLPPGHSLSFDPATRSLEVRRYWDIPYDAPSQTLSDEEELEEFSARFRESVRLRLIADVPVGIFLSGGLDSSAVAAAVKEVHNTSLNTFSIAFNEGGKFDETPFARQVAERLGTHHHELKIGESEFVDFLDDLVWFTDEPLGDPVCVPLYYVSKLAAEHVKVVLSGEGSDEVLAGYGFEHVVAGWERLTRMQRWPRLLRETAPAAAFRLIGQQRYAEKVRIRNLSPAQYNIATAPNMTRYFSSAEKCRLWPGATRHRDSDEIVRDYYKRAPTRDPLHQMLYAYCQDWLVEDLLMKADKMTMATSIELRVPFLDYQLVEWLATRPSTSKVRRDASGKLVTKYLLRRYSESRLPRSVIDRPKQGFPTPLYGWYGGPLGKQIREAVLGAGSWVGGMFDRGVLTELVENAGRSSRDGDRLWLVYVLELWAKRWL